MDPKRPDVWKDDTRMSVLFSPFRDKNLNPSSWNQKMKFWIQMIEDEYRRDSVCITDRKLIQTTFTRKGKVPLCLNEVLHEMNCQGKMRILQDIDVIKLPTPTDSAQKGWLTWGYDNLVKQPLIWGWRAVTKNEVPPEDCKYIIVDCVKDLCNKVLHRQQSEAYCDIVGCVVEYSELLNKCSDFCKSELEFKVILQHLALEKKISLHCESPHILVKFCSQSEQKVGPVSDQDVKIFRIKKTSTVIMEEVEKLSKEGDRFKSEAIIYKRQGKTQHALRNFRQFKRLQLRIQKLLESIDMLDSILGKISHAASEEMIISAIESGTKALKNITERNNIDRVTEVMDDISQAIEDQDEISSELSTTYNRLTDGSEESLEDELNDLLKAESPATSGERRENNVTQKDTSDDLDGLTDLLSGMNLPDVPHTSPAGQKKTPLSDDELNLPAVPHTSPAGQNKTPLSDDELNLPAVPGTPLTTDKSQQCKQKKLQLTS